MQLAVGGVARGHNSESCTDPADIGEYLSNFHVLEELAGRVVGLAIVNEVFQVVGFLFLAIAEGRFRFRLFHIASIPHDVSASQSTSGMDADGHLNSTGGLSR